MKRSRVVLSDDEENSPPRKRQKTSMENIDEYELEEDEIHNGDFDYSSSTEAGMRYLEDGESEDVINGSEERNIDDQDIEELEIKRWDDPPSPPVNDPLSLSLAHKSDFNYLPNGVVLIAGYVFVESDDIHTFIKALPEKVLTNFFERYKLRHDIDTNIELLANIIHPGNLRKKQAASILQEILLFPDEQINLVNRCLLEAMQRGFVNIKNIEDMDNILLEDECYNCGTHLNCTIANCLYQPLSGSDYIIGGTKAAVICLSCGIGNYVTGICIGKPRFVCGLYHLHCNDCPGTYGQCCSSRFDSVHCKYCGNHYYPTIANFPCSCNYLKSSYNPF